MKTNCMRLVNLGLGLVTLIILLIAFTCRGPKEPAPSVNVDSIINKARMDSATAAQYMVEMEVMKIYADSLKSIATAEKNKRIARDKELFALKKAKAKAATPEESIAMFLSKTDSTFQGPAPDGIVEGTDTLYKISVMNIRQANWLFVNGEEDEAMTLALLDYQTDLLNAYDAMDAALNKAKLSSMSWEQAYTGLSAAVVDLGNKNAILTAKEKRVRMWAWVSTGIAGVVTLIAIF